MAMLLATPLVFLAQEAELLLIDEPTSALDPQHQVAVFDLIARLTGEGRCGVVVTHDLNLASQFMSQTSLNRALSEVNAALALDPRNQAALAMRSRVEVASNRGFGWW